MTERPICHVGRGAGKSVALAYRLSRHLRQAMRDGYYDDKPDAGRDAELFIARLDEMAREDAEGEG